jgi:hypothetical protein
MKKQETRRSTQGLEEIDTYEMLDKLRPIKRGRCKRGKSCGSACVITESTCELVLDERICVALSRAASFVKGMPQREAEVKAAAADVLRTARLMERKQEQRDR